MSRYGDYSPRPYRRRRRHSVGPMIDAAADSFRTGWNESMAGAAVGGLGIGTTLGATRLAYGGAIPYGQYGGVGTVGVPTPGVTMVPPQTAPNQVIQPTVANTVGTSTPAVVITPQMTTTALPGQAGVGPQTVATGATLAQPGLSAVAPQVAGTYTSGYGGYYGPGYGTGYYSAGYNTGYGTYPAQSAMQVPQGSTVIVQREPSYQRRHHHHHRRRPRSADTYYRDYAYDY